MSVTNISHTGYHSKIIVKNYSCFHPNSVVAIATKIKAVAANILKAPIVIAQGLSNAISRVYRVIINKPQLPYVILSLDGGGVRGKVSLAALKLIEEEIGGKVIQAVDCIAGSSTGGIISAALSIPSADNPCKTRYSAKEVDELYDEFSQKIFAGSPLRDIRTLHGSIGAKYASPRAVMESIVTDMPLNNSLAKKIIITSVDVLSGNVIFFENNTDNNYSDRLNHQHIKSCIIDSEATFGDALEATTAAPTYFPTKVFKDYNLIDGGIAENNPAEIATLLALKEVEKDRPILVISIGTGKMPYESITTKDSLSWGWVQWMGPIINYLFHTNAQQTNAQMELLAEDNPRINYVRFQVTLEDPSEFPLDNADPENMRKLGELGTRTFKHFLDHGGRENIIIPLKQKLKALSI